MQNAKISLCALIILSALSSISCYAGKELCPKDAVHCSYVSGLSSDLNDGRFVKLSNSKVSLVVCFNSYGLAFLDQDSAGKYVGINSDQYSICSDAQGKNCEPIGLDTFVIAKNVNSYSAEPKFYAIDLSTVKNKYPACGLSAKSTLKI